MSEAIAPNQTVTFTITAMPRRDACVKTLGRLMRMQPEIQRALGRLAVRRDREVNVRRQRAGREWTSRTSATKIVSPAVGESFTLHVTPQLVPDIESVKKYLSVGA